MTYSNNNSNGRNNSYGRKPYDKNFKRPSNVSKTLTLGSSDKYDAELCKLSTLISSVPFNKISIPVTMSKAIAFNNDEARGFITVGYVNKYSAGKFEVTILHKFDEKVPAGSVVVPKIKTNREGEPTFIVAFSIEDGAPAKVSTLEAEATCEECTCDCACSVENEA